MSIYHLSIKIGSRSKGQSAISASAYRSGGKMYNAEIGKTSDYTRKGGVVFSEVSICENAPAGYMNRETLWNEVMRVEKSTNAQLWREFEVALPQELSREQQIETVQKFVRSLTDEGMCVDWSLHDKGDGNPHAHLMATVRSIKENGEWAPKCRKVYDLDENGKRIFQKVDKSGRKQYKSHKETYNDWNEKGKVEEWRIRWAECCNELLPTEKKIDHRSYKRQGIDQKPTIHEGYIARKIERNGGTSERAEENREIRDYNQILAQMTEQMKELILLQIRLQQDMINAQKKIKKEKERTEKKSDILRFEMEKLNIFSFSEKKKLKQELSELEEKQNKLKTQLRKLQSKNFERNEMLAEIRQICNEIDLNKTIDDFIQDSLEVPQTASQSTVRQNLIDRLNKTNNSLKHIEQANIDQPTKKNDLSL